MKKTIERLISALLLGAWALFAIHSGNPHTHKCTQEWKMALPSYSSKPSLKKSPKAINLDAERMGGELPSCVVASLFF